MKQEKAADPTVCPRDPSTGEALSPSEQPGYYPGFSTLSQRAFWDKATRDVVTARTQAPSPPKFFSPDEWKFWTVVFAHLIPQTDRIPERQIPLLPPLDQRLHLNKTAGYRFENMPEDREVYKIGIEAINQEAQHRYGGEFLELPHLQRDLVLQAIHDGKPQAARHIWKKMSVHRFWQLILGDAMDAYYAHPWAWDEIGFGGPAYPRAYTRLERGEPEPWEVEEKRYAWLAPSATVSDSVESGTSHHIESEQHQSHK